MSAPTDSVYKTVQLFVYHCNYQNAYTLFIIPIGTHKVQDLSVTVYTHQVCVDCVLADWAKTNSCQVTIYSEIT